MKTNYFSNKKNSTFLGNSFKSKLFLEMHRWASLAIKFSSIWTTIVSQELKKLKNKIKSYFNTYEKKKNE